MNKTIFTLLAASLVTVLGAGCYSTPEGRMKATVAPFSKDTIESRYERPVEQIFAAAKEVLNFNGKLYGENTITKTLEARVNTQTVWVAVNEVEPKTSRVRVQARGKGGLADIALAAEIDKQIALRLANPR